MTLEELKAKYSRLPKEIKEMNRWVCYRKADKAPMNALTGKFASSTNKLTWTSFNCAIMGCIKFHFDGIGFMLGDGIFGVDLDNHEDKVTGQKPYNAKEFEELIDEFVVGLNSYAERSQSGEGVHIICKGKLPENANNRRNGVGVEMYDSGRYFATTGDVVNDMAIEERSEQIKPLWEKYLKVESPIITLGKDMLPKQSTMPMDQLHLGNLLFSQLKDNHLTFLIMKLLKELKIVKTHMSSYLYIMVI